jgi:L-2-hydroxyglutarate oxidase
MSTYDFAIVGGGIVGLATGLALTQRYRGARIVLLEKEERWAQHQTGRNSGVIHSGIYYKPGSFKAKLARAGSQAMVRFCQEYGIPHDVCGKVVVATRSEELPLLESLFRRSRENGLDTSMLGPEELREIEPHVNGLAGIRVPSTGIIDYARVSETLAQLLRERDVELHLGTPVEDVVRTAQGVELVSRRSEFRARVLVNCAGLHSDRLARQSGRDPQMRIIPFRGEYYRLRPEKRYLVRHLIYPVPNPQFPFLGVHFTRMIDGEVEAGPNAVLSLKREGYTRTAFHWRDCAEIAMYPGMWKLASRYWREGVAEIVRSFSKAAFVRSLQQLVPEVEACDLEPAPAGVRAQALRPNGELVDDFHVVVERDAVHVCNAPSPAATASLEIGKLVADRIAAVDEGRFQALSVA